MVGSSQEMTMTNATGQRLSQQLINSLSESINKYASQTIFANTQELSKTVTPLGISQSNTTGGFYRCNPGTGSAGTITWPPVGAVAMVTKTAEGEYILTGDKDTFLEYLITDSTMLLRLMAMIGAGNGSND
jgi:hypothetical protein